MGAAASRRREDDLGRIARDVRASRARCYELQEQVDAAATVTAALAAENDALRRQATETASRTIAPFRRGPTEL